MYLLCRRGSIINNWNLVVIAVAIYALVFGVRYGVGMDYFSYLDAYLHGDNSILSKEQGFILLINSLHFLGAHFSVFFGIVAFAQLILCFRLIKNTPEVYPWLVLSFMLSGQWLVFGNGLRQEVAFAIFAMSLIFIKNDNKKLDILFHFLFIVLAVLFHLSAAILFAISIALIIKKEWFHNIKIQLLIYVIAFFFPGINAITMFFDRFDYLIELLGYDRYVEDEARESLLYKNTQLRLGFYIIQMINLICIINSNKVKQYFKDKLPVLSIYNLFFVGILWGFLFGSSQLLNRINYYFYQFQFIFAALTMTYLFKNKKKNICYILLICYTLLFAARMFRAETNTAIFRFFWDYI